MLPVKARHREVKLHIWWGGPWKRKKRGSPDFQLAHIRFGRQTLFNKTLVKFCNSILRNTLEANKSKR